VYIYSPYYSYLVYRFCEACIVTDICVERAPRYVERCTVCDTYERYMGKPYWGHQNGCHPVGLKQVPVEVPCKLQCRTCTFHCLTLFVVSAIYGP